MPQPPEPPGDPAQYVSHADQYVVGILYENDPREKPSPHVILMEKMRPEWQKGKLNGVGGKIENGEDPQEAMAREWEEEVDTPHDIEWDLFCALNDHQGGAMVFFFRSQMPEEAEIFDFSAAEDEPLISVSIDNIWRGDVIWNIPWVVHLGLDPNVTMSKVSCTP